MVSNAANDAANVLLQLSRATTEEHTHLSTPSTPKRQRMFQLFANGTIVGEGEKTTCATNHGHSIDCDSQVLLKVTSVFDREFVPAINNLFEETLEKGQFVTWDVQDLLGDYVDTTHAKVRKVAREII